MYLKHTSKKFNKFPKFSNLAQIWPNLVHLKACKVPMTLKNMFRLKTKVSKVKNNIIHTNLPPESVLKKKFFEICDKR